MLFDENEDKKECLSLRMKSNLRHLFNFSNFDLKTKLYILLFALLIVISFVLMIYNFFFDNTFIYKLLAEFFINPVYNLQLIGVFLFLLIMAIQGLIVPLPSEVVLLAAGMIYGWLLGGILGILGSMAAGILCFQISRKGGRPLVNRFVGGELLDVIDRTINKYGLRAIIISRFIPFIPFDIISYASGFLDVNVKKYAFGTLVGSIFRSFFYSIWGSLLGFNPPIDTSDLILMEAQSIVFNNVLVLIIIIFGVMFLGYLIIKKRLNAKFSDSEKMVSYHA